MLLWTHHKHGQNVTPWIWPRLRGGDLRVEGLYVLGSDEPGDLKHAYNFDLQLRATSAKGAGDVPKGEALMRSVLGLGEGAGVVAAAAGTGSRDDVGARIAELKRLLGAQLGLWREHERLRNGHVSDACSLVAFLGLIVHNGSLSGRVLPPGLAWRRGEQTAAAPAGGATQHERAAGYVRREPDRGSGRQSSAAHDGRHPV